MSSKQKAQETHDALKQAGIEPQHLADAKAAGMNPQDVIDLINVVMPVLIGIFNRIKRR